MADDTVTKPTTSTPNAAEVATPAPIPYKGLTGATIVPLTVGQIPTKEQVEEILACYKNLHRLLATYGKEALPKWEEVGPKGRTRINERANEAVGARFAYLEKLEREELAKNVSALVEEKVREHRKGREAYDKFIASQPEPMRAHMPAYPSHIDFELTTFAPLFPQGTPIGVMANRFEKASYTVVKKAQDTFLVRIPVHFTAGNADASKADGAKAA